jgi:putative SOS response-associated peptidase YedK
MCARVGFFSDGLFINDVHAVLGNFVNDIGTLTPRYNIAPSQDLPTLLNDRRYTMTSFGLIPHWAKDAKRRPANARAESVAEKPMFRSSFQRKRALVPVNGFYEWQQLGKEKQPYWFRPTTGDYFALGAIWDEWHDNDSGEVITSSAIITTEPNDLMRPIHDRMPVIIPRASWGLWLDSEVHEQEVLRDLLQPCNSDLMEAYPVSTHVNSPANDNADLIVRASRGTLF